eukprot:jgi/Botrbrau1/17326/Bobra.0015s0072.1
MLEKQEGVVELRSVTDCSVFLFCVLNRKPLEETTTSRYFPEYGYLAVLPASAGVAGVRKSAVDHSLWCYYAAQHPVIRNCPATTPTCCVEYRLVLCRHIGSVWVYT